MTIEDIDTAPLQSEYIESVTALRKPSTMLMVGHEVYKGNLSGKCPVSTMTAEGEIFHSFFSADKNFDKWIESFKGLKKYRDNEDPFNRPEDFSDESLIRVLADKNIPTTRAIRSYDPRDCAIDRSWWNINKDKLYNNKYVCCNFLRPLNQNKEKAQPIIDFLDS